MSVVDYAITGTARRIELGDTSLAVMLLTCRMTLSSLHDKKGCVRNAGLHLKNGMDG